MVKRDFFKKVRIAGMTILFAVFMTVAPINSVYAASQVECENGRPVGSTMDKFAESGILFYNPCDNQYVCSPGAYLDGPVAISGSTVEEKIWAGLTGFLTPEQAAGVMGNMEHESHFNPAQHEVSMMNKYQPGFALDENSDVSYGLGLIQWSFGRRIGMYNYVKSSDESLVNFFNDYQKYSPTYSNGDQFVAAAGEEAFDKLVSLELQYLKDELNNNSSYSGILQTTTVYDATKFFLENVEKPENPTIDKHMDRVTSAENFYNKYSGSISGGSCSTNLQSLADYVVAYAWPTYMKSEGRNFTERMPMYAEAVSRRVKEDKYVGGTVDGVAGIDCGGFVTTVMQESGFDPEYNGCRSNTGPQEYWLREGGGSANWEWLNSDGHNMNAADLQLGDVAFTGEYTGSCSAGGEHTFMFIGDGLGFETNVASASYSGSSNTSGRAPMSGRESVSGAR